MFVMFTELAKLLRLRSLLTAVILICCAAFSTSANASCGAFNTGQATSLSTFSPFQTPALVQQSSSIRRNDDGSAPIVGLWNATFYAGGQVFDQGIDQWHSDGTEILNDIAAPQPANGAGTVCLGVFKKTGPRSVKLRHPFWSFDSNGNLAATGVILEDLNVAPGAATYSGSFSYKVYDLSGNLIFSTEGTILAQRITAD